MKIGVTSVMFAPTTAAKEPVVANRFPLPSYTPRIRLPTAVLTDRPMDTSTPARGSVAAWRRISPPLPLSVLVLAVSPTVKVDTSRNPDETQLRGRCVPHEDQ